MLKRSKKFEWREGHFNFNLKEAAVKALPPSPNRCTLSVRLWCDPLSCSLCLHYFFWKIAVLRLFFFFFLPSAGRHYFENRSAREERRQLPPSPPELLSSWISIFKGSCAERKGPWRPRQPVCAASVNPEVSWQQTLRRTQIVQP